MNQDSNNTNSLTRRDFLKTSSTATVGGGLLAALAGCKTPIKTPPPPAAKSAPAVHVTENNTIQVALIGCGGRGTGAAANALSVNNGPIKLVAMADAFEDRLKSSHLELSNSFASKMDVPEDRKFIGFDGYKKAVDCLKPGDVAIFTTPLAFRAPHFAYAIEKNVNVFMEKPLTADGPSSRKMLKLAEESEKKNLKVGVGLMSRHSRALQELKKRIEDGEIGDVVLLRGYRMSGPVADCFSTIHPANVNELEWQIRKFHGYLWASGGLFNDFFVHHIDHCCWMKGSWPVKAQALGGRHYKTNGEGAPFVDQNFDSYAVEYTFDDGTKFMMDGRCVPGCNDIYSSYAHGTKGMAVISKYGDCGLPSSTFKGLHPTKSGLIWESKVKPEESNPYQNEWNALIAAIRDDKPHNEAKRGVEASLAGSMGRMAAHTGMEISWDDMLNCEHEFAPNVDQMVVGGPAPLVAVNGKYPVPNPGITTKREY